MASRSSSDLGMGSNDSYHSGSPDSGQSDSALGLKMLDFGSLNELTNQNAGRYGSCDSLDSFASENLSSYGVFSQSLPRQKGSKIPVKGKKSEFLNYHPNQKLNCVNYKLIYRCRKWSSTWSDTWLAGLVLPSLVPGLV